MFVLLSGSHANALVFGSAVLTASTPAGTSVDFRLQKFFAILIVAAVCLFQSFSRLNYVRFSNIFAIYKITLLTIITILGWRALGTKYRSESTPHPSEDGYGLSNFNGSFDDITKSPYAISIALLDILRVYAGYENANFVWSPILKASAITLFWLIFLLGS
jgi:amino acid transporter